MKKVFLMLPAVLLFANANSQNLQILDYGTGTPYANGQNIYQYLPPTDQNNNPTLNMFWVDVHNQGMASVAYKVKRDYIQQVPGSVGMYCQECGSGLCFTGPVSSQYTLASAASCDWDIRYNVGPTPLGTSIIRYTAFNVANVNDSACIIMHYIVTPAAVPLLENSTASLSDPLPNPASGTVQLDYKLAPGTTATLEMMNLLGEQVAAQSLATASGKATFDVAGMPAGIYYCILRSAGQAMVTRKLVVTH
jgi:hypothetical protein